MTVETRSIIEKDLDILLSKIVESVYTGVCEDMSPNDIEFSSIYEKELDHAQQLLLDTLQEETNETI